MTRAGAGGW
uniref:Uncharacterized protein n=1 Tax=Arundo donax TaxID=35708 RepID=A0A0A9AQ46_ARUDO